uniref:Uncharacterized protein n=1 Tax=Meloidogyne javanica TaxID=6303 RepID=A0A915M2Z0_MELJA
MVFMILALLCSIAAFIWNDLTFCCCIGKGGIFRPLPSLASAPAFLRLIALVIYYFNNDKDIEKLKNSKYNKNGESNSGGDIGFVEHFDKVSIASTSSPANLSALGKNGTINHSDNDSIRHRNKNSERVSSHNINNNRLEYGEDDDVNSKITRNRIKPSFLSSSVKHRKPQSVKKKRGNEAATTEDIPDPYKDGSSGLDKKSKSANEMSQSKRPGFLQRIRQRLSLKSVINQEKRLNERERNEQNNDEEIKVLRPQLLNEDNKMEERNRQQKQTLQYQRSEDIDALSQAKP